MAIGLCALLILVTVVLGYLLSVFLREARARTGSRSLGWLLAIYGGGLLTVGTQFLSYVLRPDLAALALPWVSAAGAVAMFGFVRFAYEFHRPNWRGSWINWALNAVYLSLIAVECWIAIMRTRLLLDGMVEFREAWLDFPFTSGFLVAYVCFGERYAAAIRAEVGGTGGTRGDIARAAFRALARPALVMGKRASAARAYLYLSLLPLAHMGLLVLRAHGVVDWAVVEPVGAGLFLLLFGGFAVAYLNYAPEQSSFQAKLVGSTLIAVLAIISGLVWLVGPVYIEAYRPADRLHAGASYRFEPEPDGAYTLSRIFHQRTAQIGDRVAPDEGPITLDFDFPFFGQSYDQLYLRPEGLLGFEQVPLWRNLQYGYGPQPAIYALSASVSPRPDLDPTSGLFVTRGEDVFILTFNNLVSDFDDEETYTYEVRLFADGRIEVAYHALPDHFVVDLNRPHAVPMAMGILPDWPRPDSALLHLSETLRTTGAPGQGLRADFYGDFRIYLDRLYRPTAGFVVFASLIALLLFPRFYHNNLNRPLKAMMGGVQDILRGDLNTSIHIGQRDELGYLAQSFNQMARSQRELVADLEKRVAERTEEAAELAARNARLAERQHLSRELHDSVSQALFSANLIASRLPDLVENDGVRARDEAALIQGLNTDALREMRLLLRELRSDEAAERTFGGLLGTLVKGAETIHGVDVDVRIDQDLRLPDLVQRALFRVAQEALHNALKHSGAAKVVLRFDGIPGQAFLSIEDDGSGFQAEAEVDGKYGLKTMRERLDAIGGSLEIETTPGEGTRVTAIWYDSYER